MKYGFFWLIIFNLLTLCAHPEPVRVLWKENFDVINDLKIEFREGAKGEVKIIRTSAGKKQLKIAKHNSDGYIVISSRRPLTAPAGTELQSSIRVYSTDADPEYALGFLRLHGKKEDLSYFGKLDGRGGGGPKMRSLTNTAPGRAERKLAHRLVDETTGNSITPVIVVTGTPSESFWENWLVEDFKAAKEQWKNNLARKQLPDCQKFAIPEAEFDTALAADTDHTAKIVTIDGRSQLLVDGKPALPVFFKANAETRLKKNIFTGGRADRNGIDLQVMTIRFGDSVRRRGFWSKKGFDVKGAVELVKLAMRTSPNSKFILTLLLDPYQEFTAEHPQEVWVRHDGMTVYGHYTHTPYFLQKKVPSGYWPWISYHSPVWRQEVKKHLSALISELKRTQLAKRVIGIHLAGMHDCQFVMRHLDYSIPAQAAFKEFVRQKYQTVAALQKAWQRNDIKSFDEVKMPLPGNSECFRPGKDEDKFDAALFQKRGAFAMQEDIARHIRKEFAKDIVIARWCMAAFAGDFYGSYDITPFVESKEIDILIAQPAYGRRTPGIACGGRLPFASFHLNGKLYLSELDLRTYCSNHGGETELRQLGLSYAVDYPMWQNIHRRLTGQMAAHRMGYWYYDMAPGWFEAPEIAADLGKNAVLHRRIDARVTPWHPDAAVVVDETGLLRYNLAKNYYNYDEKYAVSEQLQLLAGSSVPYDTLLLSDLLKSPETAKRYKLLVFAGMYHLDAPRKNLIASLKNGNRTLIFLAGTGRLGGVKSMTGFTIGSRKRPADHEIIPVPGEKNNMLSAQHSNIRGAMLGQKISSHYQPPRFHIAETPGIHVHARYKKDGKPAIASRQFGTWRSVFVAEAGGLTPEFFNAEVKRAGGYVPERAGLQIEMNGDFISLHCIIPGKYRLILPRKTGLTDLFSGKKVSPELELNSGESRWFALGD